MFTTRYELSSGVQLTQKWQSGNVSDADGRCLQIGNKLTPTPVGRPADTAVLRSMQRRDARQDLSEHRTSISLFPL